ncbi:MAG TPA: hypothetical protein VK487_00955 [Candidatus Bathyarchaeia archaeon]|nr:hypothetical protein [Candidatus Bathyarchaeia archaeon]
MSEQNPFDFEDLENRVKQYEKWERRFEFLRAYFALSVLIGFIPPLVATDVLATKNSLSFYVFLVVFPTIWLLVGRQSAKRMFKYSIDDEQWTRYYSNSIVKNLQKYSKEKNPEMKNEYRRNAQNKARDFLYRINKTWTIGTFKLSLEFFGDSISRFKDNVEYRLIPNIKQGDDKLLELISVIMSYLTIFSNKFDLRAINVVSKLLEKDLQPYRPTKKGFRRQVSSFLGSHRIVQHSVFVLAVVIACVIFSYVVITYLHISTDYAFGAAVAIFIGLLTIYFAKQ